MQGVGVKMQAEERWQPLHPAAAAAAAARGGGVHLSFKKCTCAHENCSPACFSMGGHIPRITPGDERGGAGGQNTRKGV